MDELIFAPNLCDECGMESDELFEFDGQQLCEYCDWQAFEHFMSEEIDSRLEELEDAPPLEGPAEWL